jgi:hypothetical protein
MLGPWLPKNFLKFQASSRKSFNIISKIFRDYFKFKARRQDDQKKIRRKRIRE